MISRDLLPLVADASEWLDAAIRETPYGECSIVVRLHEGREPIVEYHQITKIKTVGARYAETGAIGGSHGNRTR